MPTQHIHAARKRFVGLIHRIAAKHHGVSTDPGLRVDHRIPPDHRRAAMHLAADVHASKQDEDVPGQISLHLHRTEQAGRVMHLLASSNKYVLSHISTVTWSLAECANRKQKRQNQVAESA
jgi:hypothetical protein